MQKQTTQIPKSVKANNISVKRMYEIAEVIGKGKSNKLIIEFIKLLDIKENRTNIWAATHLLELIPTDKKIERKALDVIENIAQGTTSEAMGYRMWLKEIKLK